MAKILGCGRTKKPCFRYAHTVSGVLKRARIRDFGVDMENNLIIPDWFASWFCAEFGETESFSVRDLRCYFGKHQIYTALTTGSLGGIKAGGKWIVPRPALRDWLLENFNLNF